MSNIHQQEQVEERLAELMSEYVDREADGTAPPVEEFLASCPDVAAELRPLLHTSARLSRAAQTIRPVGSADAAFEKIQARLLAGTDRDELRTSVERGDAVIPVDRRQDLLLLLVRAASRIFGNSAEVILDRIVTRIRERGAKGAGLPAPATRPWDPGEPEPGAPF